MKNFLLLNQSFGTVGSPNQTSETLTRENRVGLMSYLRRILMLFFAVLVMSMANVGMAWGEDVTWNITEANVTTLTATQGASITIGSGSKQYSVHAVRGGGSNKNSDSWVDDVGMKFGDGNLYKSGIAVYVPTTSNNISSISFYMKKSADKARVVKYYAADAIALTSEPSTSTQTLTTSFASYSPFSSPAKGKYYIVGGYTGGSSDVYLQKVVVTFADAAPSTKRIYMKAGAWNTDSPYFYAHSWGSSNSDVLMTLASCESDVFYADIPSGNTSVLFTRQSTNSGIKYKDETGNYNQSADITISTNDKFTFSTWADGDGKSTFTGGTYSAPTYTISFDGNGSSSGSTSSHTGISCNGSQTLRANGFSRTGWTFTGWNTSAYGDGDAYAAGATISSITSDITLYAQWSKVMYVRATGDLSWWYNDNARFAVWVANAGETKDAWVDMTKAENCSDPAVYKATVPGNGYTKVAFVRMDPAKPANKWDNKWNHTSKESMPTSNNQFTITGGSGDDCTGSWGTYSAPTLTVTYNDNGSTGGSVPTDGSSPYACGSTVTVLGNTGSLVKTGYTFAGWNTAAGGGGDAYAAAETFTISANTTLYAQWDEIKYTVTYNVNGGGSVTPTSATQASSGASVTLPTPTWSGYTFDGWYNAGMKIGNGGASYTPTADITLYAHWTDNISGKVFSFIDNNYGDKFKAFDLSGWVTSDASKKDKTYTNATTGVQLVIDNGTWETKSNAIAALVKLIGSGTNVSDIDVIIPTGKIATVKISYGAYGKGDDYRLTVNSTAQANPDNKLDNGDSNAEVISHMKEITLNNQTGTLQLGISNTSKNNYIGRVSAVITGYTVSYAAGTYGSGSLASGTKTAGSSFTLSSSSSAFTRDGYVYDGWSTNADGSTKDYNLGGTYSIDAAITLYPHWVASCTAPSALAAATPTAKGITLSVTDANDVNNYEFYVNTSSTAPDPSDDATHSVSSNKSLTITNLVAGTTYYAWVRSVCGVGNKSSWVALTDDTFTTSTVGASYTLTNVTKSSGATTGIGGSDFTAEFEADDEYSMPNPTVTIGGNAATSGTDYTWSVEGSVGTITIPANKINGNIAITLNSADAAPSSAVISGTYHYFPGDNISLTCTPSGNNGPTTYQWYKGGKADVNEIDGATSSTYTKNSCAFADAGSYYCKVTCNETSIWAETNDAEDYDVKILHLYVKTGRNGSDYGDVDFTKVDGSTATASISLGANWDYGFNIADGCGHYYGNSGKMTEDNCTDWSMDVDGTDCLMRTTNGATYTFTVDYSNLEEPEVSISYPSANQAADKVIYFDNQTVGWSTLHYRIGKSNHTQATAMTKVSGTNNLYKVTTAEYNGFSGWHIANNAGWTGDDNSIYRTYTNGDAYSITYATAHEGGAVTDAAVTVTPTTSRGNGSDVGINDNCEFYNYSLTTGMKTQNVAISPYSNGTITVNYTNTSNVASTLTSGNADLAHSVILTSITAVADEGYDASAITINGGAYSANYVVTGNTTIAASFTPHVYTITLNKGDHGASNQSASVAYLDDELTSITPVTSTGYNLTGYFDGSTKVLNADGSFAASTVSGYITDGVWTKTANTTLTAKWEAKTTTLTFDANTSYHGTTGDGGATATYDETALASVTHTTPAAGYQLDGYYTTATGEGTKIVTASGTLVASTSYTTAGGAWHSELANLTLYARYTDKSYSVTHTFTNASRSSGGTAGASAATHGTDYSVVVAATSGYVLPSTITVTIGGETATSGTEYTWNQASGTVTIGGSYITGDIVITVSGTADCPSSASGAVVYKWVTKSSGLGTSAICANKDQDYPLTTGDGKPLETLTSGTLTARASSAATTNLKYNTSSINFNGGSAGWLIIGLNCAIQSGDIIRYVNSNSGSVAIHTAKGTSTNEIVLAGNSKTTIQTVVISAAQATAFNGLKTIYMERKSGTSDISYFEIIRPYVVTLDANTNGGKVGGENTQTMYFVADEAQLLPRATKSDYLFKGWFNASSGGDAVANPYTATTSPKTLYAQFDDCSSTSGTVYKIQVKTGLTNGSIAAGDLNEGNYLSAMDGGTAVITGSHAQIVNNNAIDFKDNGDYITVNLDCELKAGDYFKTTISGSKSGIKVTTTSSTTSLQNISYGTNVETEVPASLVGQKTFRIYRQDSNCGGLSYFEIVRPAGSEVTYNNGGHGVAPSSTTAAAVTLADISVTGWKNTGWKADVDVKVSGSTVSAGTEIAVGTVVTILEATTFTAQWVDCCFEFTSSSQSSSVSSVAVSGNVTASLWETGKASLTGGTITNSGTEALGINKTYGMVFDGSTKEITVTLAEGHALGVGSVITLSAGVSDGDGSHTSGLVVNGNTCSPASCTSSTSGYGFTQSYTVTALDGLAGRKSFTIAKKSDLAKTYLHGITVTGCAEVTGYTIAFEGNGNTGGSMTDVTEIEEGDDVTLAANGFTKNGYSFANWTADVAVTINSATVDAGDPIADEATIQNVMSDITLTAVWTPNTYDITYNLNGASWAGEYSAPANYTVGTGATLPVAGDMTNTGYSFNGWKNNSGLTGDNITAIGTSEYGNKEFWAKWTENTYTVTYSANGGTGDAMSNTVGHYVTLSANTYTKSGYVFAGWNTAADGSGASYSEGEEIELKANLDLYAIWATDYTITWDASPKLSGVAAKPNLGGGNYTITASVATWTGSLTTSMISAETSGVTITGVSVDNSASPKTITATFNVGASVVGDKISFTLDVPANGSYGAKSDTEDFDIDRCTGSSSGSDGVLFSAEFKDSGLGTSDICTAANTAYTFTTAELKAAPTGGSIKAFSTSNLSHMKYATNAISIAGSNGVIQIDLDNAIATNDLFTYVNVNSSSSSAYLRHTSPTTTTDQIALTVYNSKEAKVRLTSGFNGKKTLYIVRNNNDFKLHKAAVVRPAFLMLLRDDTPTSDTNLDGTDQELTTLNYLTTINGGRAYYTSPSSGNLKIKRSNSKNYINFNNAAGYVKIVLNEALQEGDVIGFDSYNTNELALTITATRSTTIRTTSQLYTVGSSSPLKDQTTFYLWQNSGSSDFLRGLQIARSGVAGGGGGTDKITTTLTWDTDLSGGVAAETGDADFTHTVTQDKNSLGAITYSSNNTSVATVNASGKVHIVGAGNATITATMAASGCYKEATATYAITVTDNCADVAGTITVKDLGCGNGYELTVSGHTIGDAVTYQWYKDGVSMGGSYVAAKCTVTVAGEYYVVVDNTGSAGSYHCAMASTNTITIEATEAATASAIVDSWYIKNGRRTPDIALVQTEKATNFTVKSGSTVIWNSDGSVTTGFAGCAFYLGTDGIIYLRGQQEDGSAPTGLTSGDETLKFTAIACGGNSDELSITIHKQESTARPSVAFVVDGEKEGDFDAEEENHSVNTELYQYLDYGADMTGAFDLTGQNVYSTVDEQAIREHYSQFDAILITDDPSTDTKIGKKSCVDAFGTMIDVRPILTMEAFVSKWGNWKAKGIDGNPESPNPRQYKMKLQCKDHAIFKDLSVGTNVETETIDGVEYWTVTMVDNTKSPYSGVADGTDTDTKPALQGFSADDVSSLLLLGEISGGSLYAGVERQEETAARLMLLGLNAKALPNALTPEGKKVIENALKYLIETDLEKVDDCANYFTGKTSTDWNTDSNWSKGHVPHSPNVRVRILSECVINSGTYKVAEVDIATSGKSLNKAGEMTGKLTINADAALIVGGKIRTAEAPYFNTGDLMPTTEEDLVINTSSTAQAALIFNNDAGDTKATVEYYSLGRKYGDEYQFQYFASPMDYLPINPAFAGSGIYTYAWNEAIKDGWERRGYYTDVFGFEGLAITTKFVEDYHYYTMKGTLASTADVDIPLTYTDAGAGGQNLIGNSWTAPINIASLVEAFDDDANVEKTVNIYNSGNDDAQVGAAGTWTSVPISVAGWAEWEGLKVIPAMQAFRIDVTSETKLTMNYEKMVRETESSSLNEPLKAPSRRSNANGVSLMRIRLESGLAHTDLFLIEGGQFSEAFDNGYEAKFIAGEDNTVQFYAMNGEEKMAVLATDELEGTPVGFVPGKRTDYIISFSGEGKGYYFNDVKTQTSTLISEENTYSFEYEAGDDANRFYISATPFAAPSVATGVTNLDAAAPKVMKVIYNDKLYIIRGGKVFSADGQLVK